MYIFVLEVSAAFGSNHTKIPCILLPLSSFPSILSLLITLFLSPQFIYVINDNEHLPWVCSSIILSYSLYDASIISSYLSDTSLCQSWGLIFIPMRLSGTISCLKPQPTGLYSHSHLANILSKLIQGILWFL